ncbi:sensor histidine kinase [Egicoccus sp. AB-alg2]|uniref:sensor histidine kinase n=1 Tax=Egicoccus sp. AB-alg2 TaxID=3242693 RepID=UPI00359D476C
MIAIFRRLPRPPATDVAIAAAFVAIGQAIHWGQLDGQVTWSASRPLNATMNLLFLVPLAWRRRAPLAAVSFAVAVYLLTMPVLGHDITFLTGGVPLILMTASAAYCCPRPRAVLAAIVGVLGLAAASLSTPELNHWDAFAWNLGFLLVPWLGARGIRVRERRAAALATELAEERAARDAARREAAAAERAHIARELHDIVAHSVSMMVIQVGAARMRLQLGDAEAETPLLDAEEAGRQTLDDLRRLLGVLRADEGLAGAGAHPAPPQPGLARLETLIGPVREAGLDVDVQIAGDPVALPAGLDLTAYRIVQESLTNTLKHSGAGTATVRLTYTPTTLSIEVGDDGVVGPPSDGTGHGLVGIGERVALYGGTVTVGRDEHGAGWHVRTELPLPPPADDRHAAAAVPTS